jgi:hypothetical protein
MWHADVLPTGLEWVVRRLRFSVLVEVIALMMVSATAVAAPTPAARQDAGPPAQPPAATLNLADYMFGPPPHDHIDPGTRCWMRCPKKPRETVAPR